MATVESPARSAENDSSELAGFGYKQELDRSLGSFSSFAAGVSYIAILVAITTTINMLGVKLMSRINNVGVAAELIGSALLIILLLFHLHQPPSVIAHTHGYGAGHQWGYFGALLIGGLLSAYVVYGFDTAGTLAEETNNPRKHAPPAIIRAIAAAATIGGLVILLGIMSNKNIADKNIGLLGLPYVIKNAFGNTTGNVFLA